MDPRMIETRDIGLIPEPMFNDLAGEGKKYKTIYEFAQSEDYPIRSILKAAKSASSATEKQTQMYLTYIKPKPCIRDSS